MQIKDPKPEIMRLEELAILVKSGDIKLPRFQRPFVWKEYDMLKLLDSIYKGYPIGSILIWHSSQKLASERSISGLEVDADKNVFFPTNYLLDGQQRLTTLCGALFWAGENPNSIWNIHFDLDKEEFLYPKDPNLVNLFPLNRIIQTSDFIRQCMKFDHHPKRDQYFKVAERLLKSIKDYKIAVVKIGDMTIDEVAPIFERINSTGRKLTMVDLMMAATWSDGFDLTQAINDIKSNIQSFGFDGVGDPIVLRSIAASAELGINKDDIQRLRMKSSDELSLAAHVAQVGLQKAAKFLAQEFKIYDFSYVPYGFQLTYLAEHFRLVPEPSLDVVTHLKEWFWFTSVTRYFASGSTTGQVTKDLAAIRNYAKGRAKSLFDKQQVDISRLLFDKFNLRNATSTTFVALLNYLSPEKTLDGRPIDGSHLKLKSNKFFGSITPLQWEVERLNIAKMIYPYIGQIPTVGQIYGDSLAAHLLNMTCISMVQNRNQGQFIVERAELVRVLVEELTGCDVVYKLPIFPLEGEVASISLDELQLDEYGGEDV